MAGGSAAADTHESSVRWSLQLLGELRVERSDGEAVRIPGRRERALLAYLALAPDLRENRQKLTSLLWSDTADGMMLDNLRTCLWSLRKALGDRDHRLVLSDREWIGLNRDLLEVDLWTFGDLVSRGASEDFERAIAIYAGELLQGLDLDSEEFLDWLRIERARFSDVAVEALSRLACDRKDAGDTLGALAAGQRILSLEPFHEVAVRELMLLYAASGRRHTALQTYQRFADRLQKELGVAPSADTQEVLRQVAGTPHRDAPANGRQSGGDTPALSPDRAAERLPAEPPAPAEALPLAAADRPAARLAWPIRYPIWALGVLAGIALAVLITVGAIFWRVPVLAPAPFGDWIISVKRELEGAPPSIAVLSFKGYGDPDSKDFAAAISEGVTSALSITSEMLVVSRSSVLTYEARSASPQQTARGLGVRYLLEGSVTMFDQSMAVRAALIDTAGGETYIPIGHYEGSTADFFSLQREITLEVVTALRVRLTEGEQERISQAHGTRNFRAWLLTSQGQKQLRQFTPEANLAARRSYQGALAADPDYAGAVTGLAWTFLFEAQFGQARSPAELVRKAAELARRALALDDQRASTYSLIGTVALYLGELDTARRMGERAVELEYNDSDVAALLGLTLTYTGEPRRAITLVRRAIRLKPYPPRWYNWLLARANRLAGEYGEAIDILESSDPGEFGSVMPLIELTAAYSESGFRIQARSTAARLLRIQPDFSIQSWLEMPAYEDAGRARRDFDALEAAGLKE